MYAQALLDELSLGDFDQWIRDVVTDEKEVVLTSTARDKIIAVFNHLLQKVQNEEQWTNLPASALGGTVRDIAKGAPKLIGMAIHHAIDTARRPSRLKLLHGYLPDFFKDSVKLLESRYTRKKVETGTEVTQRREKKLFDHEIEALYKSILSNAVAEDQYRRRKVPQRKPIDTLTLGVIVALHTALGQRGINVRHTACPPSLPIY
jgi:hypothetical protein